MTLIVMMMIYNQTQVGLDLEPNKYAKLRKAALLGQVVFDIIINIFTVFSPLKFSYFNNSNHYYELSSSSSSSAADSSFAQITKHLKRLLTIVRAEKASKQLNMIINATFTITSNPDIIIRSEIRTVKKFFFYKVNVTISKSRNASVKSESTPMQ